MRESLLFVYSQVAVEEERGAGSEVTWPRIPPYDVFHVPCSRDLIHRIMYDPSEHGQTLTNLLVL